MSDNPILLENLKQGTARAIWDAPASNQIEGFATNISVDNGATIGFKVNVNAAAGETVPYRIEIYRLGWYGGDGATLVTTIDTSGTAQPDPITDTRGLVDAGNWSVSATWDTPENAVSGVYLAKLQRLDANGDPIDGATNQIPFIIRQDELRADGTRSDILLQTSDTTWQAYNGWGGRNGQVGGNFYGGFDQPDTLTADPGPFAQDRAFAVSYNRPIITRDGGGAAAGAQDYLFGADYAAIQWLERNGYDVSYAAGVDTDRLGAGYLAAHKAFISVGHDEYWSGAQRANVEAARDAGVNLLFCSGNEIYWKTRWETSIAPDGTEYRTLVCYKETWANGTITAGPADYANIDPSPEWTGTWRDLRFSAAVDANGNPIAGGAMPENALTGQLFGPDGTGEFGGGLDVPSGFAALRVWRDTGVPQGGLLDIAPGLIGYEWNTVPQDAFRPEGLITLSETTLPWSAILTDQGNRTAPGTATHNLSLYRAESGALVFGAGTVFWSWGLSNAHDNAPYGAQIESAVIRQFTVNLFADMGIQPGVADAVLASQSLVRASASTDGVAADVTMADLPATLAALQTLLITGSASDAAGVVALVEVSVDGGATWRAAQGTQSWSFAWRPTAEGTYSIQARAIDDSLNMQGIAPASDSVVVTAPTAPSTFRVFDPTQPVTAGLNNDGTALELGMRFTVAEAGTVTALHYWRAAGDAGDTDLREGRLWRSDGTLLATATFIAGIGESGWQTAALATPVAVLAGVQYTVSYRTNDNYVASNGFFAAANEVAFDGLDNDAFTGAFGQVSAPQDASGSGNGVYRYGAGIALPNETFQASNYWVDISFDPEGGTANTPPTILSTGFAAAENQTRIGTVLASDPDVGQPLRFAIVGGADAALFKIDIATGLLEFRNPQDFEADAAFEVTVSVSDGVAPAVTQAVAITLTDVIETLPGAASFTSRTLRAEYVFGSTADAIYPGAGATQTALVGEGVEFANLPSPASDVGNGAFGLAAIDIAAQTIRLEFPLDSTQFAGFLRFAGAADGRPFNGVRLADASDGLPTILGASIIGQEGFTGQTGILQPLDSSQLLVTASSIFLNIAGRGRLVDVDEDSPGAQPAHVTILVDLNDAPVFAGGESARIILAESRQDVATLAATDADPGQSLGFAIQGGEDAALFEIIGNALRLRAAPDFAALPDAGATAGYQVIVQVADGFGGIDTQAITVDLLRAELVIALEASLAGGDAGDLVTYTATLRHAAGSTADAFALRLADILPAGLTLVAGSALASAGTIDTTGGAIGFTLDSFARDAAPITLTWQARLAADIVAGQVLTNAAQLRYDPGAAPVASRTAQAAADITTAIVNSLAVTIEDSSLAATPGSSVGIGETVTFLLTATLGEGAQRIVLRDVLPIGLELLSSTVVSLGGITGAALGIGDAGVYDAPSRTLAFDLGDVTNPFDNLASAADQVVLRVVARVAEGPGNAAGTRLDSLLTLHSAVPENAYGVVPGAAVAVADARAALTVQRASLDGMAFIDADGDGQREAGDAALAGVTVTLLDAAGAPTSLSALTGPDGSYRFDSLVPGSYRLRFDAAAGTLSTLANVGDDVTDSDADPASGLTGIVALTDGQSLGRIDAGFYRPASIDGFVWEDLDRDGLQDANERGLAGVTVQLQGGGTGVLTTRTDADGFYRFADLRPGAYSLIINDPVLLPTLANQGDDDTRDSDFVPSPSPLSRTTSYELRSGMAVTDIDAGLYRPPLLGSLTGRAWLDRDGNGQRETGEGAIAGVTVRLLNADGTPAGRSTTSGADGVYRFDSVTAGDYRVAFAPPAGMRITLRDQGAEDSLDSDADPAGGITGLVRVAADAVTRDVDAGLYRPASIGNRVWHDLDADGVQDANERGLADVTVRLLAADGTTVLDTDVTDANGIYGFAGLAPGEYGLRVERPAGYLFSQRDRVANDALDSDVSPTTGRTTFTLTSGQASTALDAGLFRTVQFGDRVWIDADRDGVQDSGEAGARGVTVRLLGAANALVATTVTDADGLYRFSDLMPGFYRTEVLAPAGTLFTLADRGADDAADSDANISNGRSLPVTLTSGQTNLTRDTGLVLTGSIGDRVWADRDADGQQDAEEPGLAGVTLRLLNSLGAVVATTTSDGQGFYSFGNLRPAAYQVEVDTPAGHRPSASNLGNDASDSDAAAGGRTQMVGLTPGQAITTLDIGFVPDVVAVIDLPPTLLTAGNDGRVGTTGNDHIDGLAGDDNILGLAGDDALFGGDGNDAINGHEGNDTVQGGAGDDNLHGNLGIDLLFGGAGNDVMNGGYGNDWIEGGVGDDNIAGEGDDDLVLAGAGRDLAVGDGGNDTVFGGAGNDTLGGEDGNDLIGGGTDDGRASLLDGRITGLVIGDHLHGDGGADRFIYQRGDGVDWLVDFNLAEGDTLTLYGFAGFTAVQAINGQTAFYLGLDSAILINTNYPITSLAGPFPGFTFLPGTWVAPQVPAERAPIEGGSGADTLTGGTGADLLQGAPGNDTLLGNNGADTLQGQAGDDLLLGGLGADVLNGGAGIDTASYANATNSVVASLAGGPNAGGFAAGDSFIDVENLIGSGFVDRLTGDANANRLDGGAGADTLLGGAGNDCLLGGAGQDLLTGGSGADRFVSAILADSGAASPDRISDFSWLAGDRIDLAAIDADAGLAGDQAFLFLGGAGFAGGGQGAIRVVLLGGDTLVEIDQGDGGPAEAAILLTGLHTLAAADFLL